MRLIIECKGERREFRLPDGISVVGRDPGCDITFPEGSLSRRHLELELSGERLMVRDLETKNGTFVGQQRIHEAHLRPGTRLRAGNVWMRFEKEDVSDTRPLEIGSAEMERRVPDAPGFQSDEAPTPADNSIAQAAGAGGEGAGTEMIVRDGRWYVRDTATGVEVEVVPSAPSGEQGPAVLPAIITQREATPYPAPLSATPLKGSPRRRRLKIVLAGVVILAVLLLALHVQLPRRHGPQPLSLTAYRQMMANAVKEYQEGRAENAAAQLERVRKEPMQTRAELPAILLEAFRADAVARQEFEANFEEAQKRWSEVQRSAESGGVLAARDLANERLLWISEEAACMASLTEAKQALAKRDFLKALAYAAEIKATSRYHKEVGGILEEATAQVKKSAAEQVAAQNWVAAAASLQELVKASPALGAELDPKIAQYREYERQRATVEAARVEADAGTPGRAVESLAAIPADSPYAKEAANILGIAHRKELLAQAGSAYKAGDGPKALELLAKVPNADPAFVQQVKQVMGAFNAGNAALNEADFVTATENFNEVLRREKPGVNQYATDAKTKLDSMGRMRGASARQLVDAADAAAEKRDFRIARRKYQQAIALDPTNRDAPDAIKRMEHDAITDYNLALNLEKEEAEAALQLLIDVDDRLPDVHALSVPVRLEISRLKKQLGKNPAKEPENKQP